MDSVSFDAHMFQKISHECKFSSRIIITIQVMTFTRMSPGYPYGIGSFSKGGKDEFGTHSSGTGNSNNPDICGIFHSADPCKICCTIAAPVAKKADYFNIFIIHYDLSPLNGFT